jgi:hypothetical protein
MAFVPLIVLAFLVPAIALNFSSVFSDGMVLQRDAKAAIYG